MKCTFLSSSLKISYIRRLPPLQVVEKVVDYNTNSGPDFYHFRSSCANLFIFLFCLDQFRVIYNTSMLKDLKKKKRVGSRNTLLDIGNTIVLKINVTQ